MSGPTKPKPGEYNNLKVKGNATQLSGDFLDPGGVEFAAWREYETNRLITENVLAGVDLFRAQVLDSGAEVQQGAGIIRRLAGDPTPARRKYRVYIPELAIDNWPYNFEKGSDEFNSAMANAFEAYYEVPGRLWPQPPDLGAIVWVRFEVGVGGRHLLNPIITDIDSLGSQAGETSGPTGSAIDSFDSSTTPHVSDLPNISSSGLANIDNEDISNLSMGCRAWRLYKKLTQFGLTDAMARGMIGNAYSESGFVPEIGGDCGSSSSLVADLITMGGLPSSGNRIRCCSWGLWQNNVCVSTSGGTQMLRYFLHPNVNSWLANADNHAGIPQDRSYGASHSNDAGQFFTDFKNWVKADQTHAQKAVETLLNEGLQISYAVFYALSKTYRGVTYKQAENGYTPLGYSSQLTGPSACDAWWLQAYEQAAGYETSAKVNSRISDLQTVTNYMSSDCPDVVPAETETTA